MSRVLVPYSRGFEEIETVSVVDILRRAGVEVCLASLEGGPVEGRSGIVIQPDASLDDVMDQEWDMVVLPGGLPNAVTLRHDERVRRLISLISERQGWVAAICAAPTALAAYGVTKGRKVTSYPSCREDMEKLDPDCIYVDDDVVEDGGLITSRGPGTALAFALRLVSRLCGEAAAQKVGEEILAKL